MERVHLLSHFSLGTCPCLPFYDIIPKLAEIKMIVGLRTQSMYQRVKEPSVEIFCLPGGRSIFGRIGLNRTLVLSQVSGG